MLKKILKWKHYTRELRLLKYYFIIILHEYFVTYRTSRIFDSRIWKFAFRFQLENLESSGIAVVEIILPYTIRNVHIYYTKWIIALIKIYIVYSKRRFWDFCFVKHLIRRGEQTTKYFVFNLFSDEVHDSLWKKSMIH